MQGGHPGAAQLVAQISHHVQAKRLDAGGIVAKRLQAQPDPARNLGAARIRETHQLRRAGDGHDAGHDGNVCTQLVRILHKAEVRIAVVEILGNGGISTRTHLSHVGLEVSLGRAGLRMHLGVGGDLDVEVPPRFFADEGHQVAGVLKFAARAIAAGQVAPQSHQPPHAHALEHSQLFTHRLPRGANA